MPIDKDMTCRPVGQGMAWSPEGLSLRRGGCGLGKRDRGGEADCTTEQTVKRVLSIAHFLHKHAASDDQAKRILVAIAPIFLAHMKSPLEPDDRRAAASRRRALRAISKMIEKIDKDFDCTTSDVGEDMMRSIERWLSRQDRCVRQNASSRL